MKALPILALLLAVSCATEPPPLCESVMKEAGLSPGFPINVAHRLHSLTLEDLRYYFDPAAPEDNGIPTVSFNLTKNAPRVIPNAPLFGLDTDFGTQAMKHLDQVLRNMDKPDYGITNYSTLEKVAHVFHMAELWNQAKKYYELMKEKSPSKELCGCVNDMDQNGVMSELQLLALKIKYPGLTSGRPDLPYGQPVGLPPQKTGPKTAKRKKRTLARKIGAGRDIPVFEGSAVVENLPERVGPIHAGGVQPIDIISRPDAKAYEISYTLAFGKEEQVRPAEFQRHLRKFDFEGDEDDVLARAMEELQDGDGGLAKHLDSEQGWESWRNGFKGMDDHGNFEFAMFIYCKLHQ